MFKLFILIFTFTPFFVAAEDQFLKEFITGDYLLVGQELDTEKTYNGKVSIYLDDERLKVKRLINGQIIYGVAAFEPVLNNDSQVLRIRFSDKELQYEETCLLSSDLDNYARISCYLYMPGVKTINPGLEVLFINHNK